MTKERPILMSGPMVKAVLEGRKTQTRRVVKKNIAEVLTFLDCEDARNARVQYFKGGHSGDGYYGYCTEYPDEGAAYLGVSYGQPGDRLWVRETWASVDLAFNSCEMEPPEMVAYRADGAILGPSNEPMGRINGDDGITVSRWR
ncbi:MAG: hypothetical protein V3W19_04235, partial [Desulfatiglandales bacterium]